MKKPLTLFSGYSFKQLTELIERVKSSMEKSSAEAGNPTNERIINDVKAEIQYLIHAFEQDIAEEQKRFIGAQVRSYKLSMPPPAPPVEGVIDTIVALHGDRPLYIFKSGELAHEHTSDQLKLITQSRWFSSMNT